MTLTSAKTGNMLLGSVVFYSYWKPLLELCLNSNSESFLLQRLSLINFSVLWLNCGAEKEFYFYFMFLILFLIRLVTSVLAKHYLTVFINLGVMNSSSILNLLTDALPSVSFSFLFSAGPRQFSVDITIIRVLIVAYVVTSIPSVTMSCQSLLPPLNPRTCPQWLP